MSDTKIYYIDRFMIVKILMHQHASDSTNTYHYMLEKGREISKTERNCTNPVLTKSQGCLHHPLPFPGIWPCDKNSAIKMHQDESRYHSVRKWWKQMPSWCHETSAIVPSAFRILHFVSNAFCIPSIAPPRDSFQDADHHPRLRSGCPAHLELPRCTWRYFKLQN